MTFFDRVSAALTGKKSPAAPDLRKLVDAARDEVTAAERRVSELKSRRAETIATGGEAGRIELRAAISTAEADLDDAREAQVLLGARLAEKVAADEQNRRLRQYEKAQAARDAAAVTMRREYAEFGERFLALLKVTAEADRLVELANAELPQDFSELATTEWHGRIGGYRPSRIISDQTVSLWASPAANEPLPDEMQSQVEPEVGSDRGYILRRVVLGATDDPARVVQARQEVHESISYYVRKAFRRIETVHGEAGEMPARLCEMELPAVIGRDPAIWSALPAWASADMILRALAEREAATADASPLPVPQPVRSVRYELIPDVTAAIKEAAE